MAVSFYKVLKKWCQKGSNAQKNLRMDVEAFNLTLVKGAFMKKWIVLVAIVLGLAATKNTIENSQDTEKPMNVACIPCGGN